MYIIQIIYGLVWCEYMTSLTNVVNQYDNILFKYISLTQKNLDVIRTLNCKHIENIIWFSKWSCHKIFDMKIFELNILLKAFWQRTIIRWKNIEEIKIQYCNDQSNNTIGSIKMSKAYYWLSIKIEDCRNVFVGLVDVSHDWRNRWDPDKTNEQDKGLSTQVVFTAAIAKIFPISLSCEYLSSVSSSVCSVEGH